MKQTASVISTYSADVFGVASALYELGGMTVMHDASGCNSTYNTHDEPRWYDMDSMVYISGISEMEAVMGDDEKLIDDVVEAAHELSPKFIALAGTPIPMMIGTDFGALARVIEKRTGIPTFGFATNGMHDYLSGVSLAFAAFAERMTCPLPVRKNGVNILGLTPLDFAVSGYAEDIVEAVEAGGFTVVSAWSTGKGSTLSDLARSAEAEVNLVVSWAGLAAAEKLRALYGTPYVVGTPTGTSFTARLIEQMRLSCADKACRRAYTMPDPAGGCALIGESVMSLSLASALGVEGITGLRVISPVSCESVTGMLCAVDEDELLAALAGVHTVIADPLYAPLCRGRQFIRLPHEAFSGRLFRREDKNLLDAEHFSAIRDAVKEALINAPSDK